MTTEPAKARTEPVKDWTTDYDIFDAGYVKDPFPVWDELREKCPVAHTERWGGSWMPTTYEDLRKIAANVEIFSSRNPLVANDGEPTEEVGAELEEQFSVGAPPISSDPPIHTWSRALLLPKFSIKEVARYEEETRELCRSLIDGFVDKGRADAAADYAQQIPSRVIASMLGIPQERAGDFTDWVRGFLEYGLTNVDLRSGAAMQILSFLNEQIQERQANPGDDLISYLLEAKTEGAPDPIPPTHVLGTCFLLLVAGIDTTWSSIGSAMWHLAQNPDDCKRLIDEPELITSAVEELLRAYSPVTMAREVTRDAEYNGCPMQENDKILMNFPAANRDPAKFDKPDEVILDREVNPHIAFGVGIHRCAGSNLARMEMKVAIEEWLKRIPEFRLEDPEAVTWAGGQVRGPRKCAVVF
ncbi:MAG: cytochrome P450 [Chloroflexi bacterium]|nr:cytochrome P450 [Chloroflexota bacterium]MCI0839271.1 cytochrome P450 [Chloroflexota bacterium]